MGEVNNSGSKLSHTMIASSSFRVLCLQEQQHSLGKRGTELALEALKAIPSVYSEMITFLLFLVTCSKILKYPRRAMEFRVASMTAIKSFGASASLRV